MSTRPSAAHRSAVHRRGPAPGDRPYPGLFVVFEGGDGAGKSTQVRELVRWLGEQGREAVATFEPGDTPMGQQVRNLVLHTTDVGLAPRAEALLYAADRAQHVATVVRPALARGAVVVQDRYLDSSISYQGSGRELAPEDVEWLSLWATEALLPDLTVLLDVPPARGRTRLTGPADKLEAEPEAFHARVRESFLALAAREPQRYLVLDGTRPVDELARAVRQRVAGLLPATRTAAEAHP